MAGLARRGDITFVSSQDLPRLEPADFLDFTHLSKSGRDKVSERMAAIVTRLEER